MSSNEKMVMVPSGVFERWRAGALTAEDSAVIGRIADMPAEQHLGEPVDALILDDCIEHKHPGYGVGYFGTEIVKLYRGADAGEVERLRQLNRDAVAELEDRKQEIYALRAQLAERDALLRDISKKNDLACDRAYRNGLKKGFGYGINGEEDRYNSVMESYHRSIAKALAEDTLSASAESSAPSSIVCHVDESCGQSHEDGVLIMHVSSPGIVHSVTVDMSIDGDVAPVERDERALIELALSEYGNATGKHVLPGGINENQDGFVHGLLVRAALDRKP